MTLEQLLASLKDIHLPETATATSTGNLVLWPLAFVLLTAAVAAWFIWRRRSIWRREFVQDLERIERMTNEGSEGDGWARLAFLLKRLALQKQPRNEVAALSGERWLERLDELFGADLFTRGPGRGLVTFPYLGQDVDDDAAKRRREDLKATIKALRTRLSPVGPAG